MTQEQIRNLVNFGEAFEAEIEKTVEETRIRNEMEAELRDISNARAEPEPEPEPEPAEKKVTERKPVTPKKAPPPTRKPSEPSMEEKIRKAQSEARGDSVADLSQATPAGHVTTASGEVVQAYRMPSQTLSDRGREKTAETSQDPERGTRNPNFKPPR